MPDGWTTDPADKPSSAAESTNLCAKPLAEFEPKAETAAAFHESSFGPVVVQVLALYPTAEDAQAALGALARAVDSCGRWTETEQGTEFNATAGRLSFPTVGDKSISYRIELVPQSGLLSAAADTVVWRRGDTLSVLVVGGVGTADAVLLKRLVEAADETLATS